jgi:hypothetical protein
MDLDGKSLDPSVPVTEKKQNFEEQEIGGLVGVS